MDSADNSPEGKDVDSFHRKNTLDTLSKDDLVKKCKNLLSIAQKAKQAKDEASDEVKRLKEQVNTLHGKYEKAKGERTKETPCQAELNAMQEMVATLTEQKLRFTMEMDAMLKHSDTIEKQLEAAKLEERKTRQALAAASARADEQEVAAESARRQIARLLQENDTLLQRLDEGDVQLRKLLTAKEEDAKTLKGKVTSLEGELLVLQEELDGVSEESRRKNTAMQKVNEQLSLDRESLEEERSVLRKQLCEAHESLDSAAHENEELEKRLRAVTEAAERDKQTLTERLAQLAIDMKRLEECSSNAENLKDLMKILHAEKDQYFQEKEKLKHQNEVLNEQLKMMTQENETILKELEILKKNKVEHQQLVQNIEISNDGLLRDISRLEAEKQKLSEVLGPICKERDNLAIENKKYIADRQKILDRLESVTMKKDIIIQEHNILKSENRKLTECLEFVSKEKHILAEENNKLKADKQKLNEYLEAIVREKNQLYEEKEKLSVMIETINTEKNVIFNENVGLKDEKEKLNKDLRAARVEAEALRAEVHDAERRVRNAVRQTLTVLQQFLGSSPPEIAGEPLIENFPAVMAALEENLDKISTLSTRTCNGASSLNDVQRKESMSDLPPPPAELSGSGDSQSMDELSLLRTEVDRQCDIILNLEKQFEKLCTENERLKKSLRSDSGGICSKCVETLGNDELRDELDCARKQLVEKSREMQILRDEMSHALQHQGAPRLPVNPQNDDVALLRTELAARSAELDALKTEFARAKDMLKEVTKVGDKEKEIEALSREIDLTREKQASYEVTIQKYKQEVSSLQGKVNKFQSSLTKKNGEIESLKEELKMLRDNEASFQSGMEIFHEEEMKLKEEVLSLQDELAERTNSLESISSEVEILKEQCKKFNEEKVSLEGESGNLQVEIAQLKEDLNSKNIALADKAKECESLREEMCLVKEDINEKLKLLALKDENIGEKEKLLTLKNKELNEKDEQLSSKEEEMNEMLKVLSLKEKELENYVKECSEVKTEVNKKSQLLEEKMKELEILHSQCKVLESKVEDRSGQSQENIFKLQDKVVKLEKKLEDRVAENKKLENEAHRLLEANEKVLKELTTQEEEMISIKKELAVKIVEAQGLTEELKKMEEENAETAEHLKHIIHSQTEEINKLKEQQELLSIKQKDAGYKMSDLESKAKEADELKSDLAKLQLDNKNLSHDLNKQQDIISELMHAVEEKTSEVTKLREEVRVAEERYNDKQRALESLTDELANVQNSSAEALGRLATATKELGEVRERLAASEKASRELKEMQKLFEEEKIAKEILNSKLQAVSIVSGKLSGILDNIKCIRQGLVNDIEVFKEQTQDRISSCQISIKSAVEQLVLAESTRSQELLTEMNEMNQVLKQRGEVISKLQETGRELEARLHTTEDKLTNTCEELQIRERRLQDVEEEANNLRTRLQGSETAEVQSEAMSTSTLSKADEAARLKDVEESFEDRYTKLRTVAVRLKKRVAELTAQLKAVETERQQLLTDRADLSARLGQASAHAKNLQTVQLECDRLQDALDQQRKEMKIQQKSLEGSKAEIIALKEQITDMRNKSDNLEQLLETVSKERSSLESQFAVLKKECGAEETINARLKAQVNQLEGEVKRAEHRLGEEAEKLKAMQEMLEASRQECKKRSVLSLEMEDYERSVTDLQQQLVNERKRLVEVQELLSTQQEISNGLQEQLKLVEERAQIEESRCKDMKAHLAEAREALTVAQDALRGKEEELAEEKIQKEEFLARAEAQEVHLTALLGEKERTAEAARSHQQALTAQILALEDRCSHLLAEVADRDQQLIHIKTEFEGYKIRAQAVLRQKTTTNVSSPTPEEDMTEECARLERHCEALRLKLDEVGSRLEAANIELAAAQDERESAMRRSQELSQLVAELQAKEDLWVEQHREALRAAKLQMETLQSCYKQQIEEAESRLKREVSLLSAELQHAQNKLKETTVAQPPGLLISGQGISPSHHTSAFVPVKPPEPLDVALLEREEGEGSEHVEDVASPSNSSTRELVPLDKLLEASPEDESLILTTTQQEEVLVKQCPNRTKVDRTEESRVRHLASLLGEAEQDLARLNQLNSVLKEEVRRLTRSLERQQQAGSNLEYLKNVVLKFVILQGGDERSRLVPVLNTLLKLSPEEMSQLNQVARGANDPGGRGWGTYLHLWPSAP